MILQDLEREIEIWEDWKTRYNFYVPKFITEASGKNTIEEWDQDVFREFFEKSNDQCVSSLRQGYFTKSEKEKIKKNWHELAPLLKEIAESQDKPLYKVYHKLKNVIRKFTDQNRKAATNRMIAGLQPELLCTIVNEGNLTHLMSLLNQNIEDCKLKIGSDWFENSFEVLDYYKTHSSLQDPYKLMTYPWQSYDLLRDNDAEIPNNDMSEIIENGYNQEIELLHYKKQIILQGPPGTGKTRLAELIADRLCLTNKIEKLNIPSFIDEQVIKKYCNSTVEIKSARDGISYKILGLESSGVKVESSKGTTYIPKFEEICAMYKKKAWEREGELKGGNDSYSAAVAKHIYRHLELADNPDKEQFIKLLQFHPSYTYEDFVRGIVSRIDEENQQIIYEAENKTLAQFSKVALENYILSQQENEGNSEVRFSDFIDHIIETIDEKGKFMLSDVIYIFYVDDKRFKYKGDNWTAHPNGLNMNFYELQKIINLNLDTRQKIVKEKSLNALTRQHASYYHNFNEFFKTFQKQKHGIQKTKIPLNNYVLIIDEINRANLSSVLGELIYALEYRGKALDSMYEVNGSAKIILPPNLFIIGTMNTADRSVGHIDYAIRRRFAFVNVLPKSIKDLDGCKFDNGLFKTVSNLFVKDFTEDIDYSTIVGDIERSVHLSMDFNPEDVWLGHSYFIYKNEEEMEIRWAYEIKPILLEYIKDGVLKESAKEAIKNIKIN
ncbi:hypothetical protein HDF26_002202 [Pedobacter cryoconitis]|uniref:AAA family ATPase n=1 Tax=Pedobacter cryoconitis TaxID=188932 RepID=UPI0017DBED88|nr:AAA family ATPase [Pedobacter cryoconitis]MBB6271745.1 hypothetical protein [Pedobacter cryoconitis]